jgi:hypothetical protein
VCQGLRDARDPGDEACVGHDNGCDRREQA